MLAASPAAAAPPASGDWVVTGSEVYVNQTIVLEGNLFVRAPGNLSLFNVTLQINSTAGTRRGLLVEAGAIFRTGDMDNISATVSDRTIIRPVGIGERIWFVAAPDSTIDLRQSALWGIGYTQSPANASGVYLQTTRAFLDNISVYASFFGIVITGSNQTYYGLTVHNNTYNGIDISGDSDLTIGGATIHDNNGTGIHVAGARLRISGASILHNGDGVASKFGANVSVSSFDVSGNGNAFVVLNGAALYASQGRATNNTQAGADARQTSTFQATLVILADNPTGIYASLGSNVTLYGTTIYRPIRGVQLRSGSYGSIHDLRIEGASGDAIDFDLSSADIFTSTLESNAFAGTVTGSTSFAFLDSAVLNSTAGGLTFVNSTGVYLHNPVLVNNRGRAIDLVGSSTSVLDASGTARIDRSVVDVRSLQVTSTLLLTNSTLHAVAAQAWTISGTFNATNASIVGDVAGASLTLQGGAAVRIRGLAIVDFSLRFSGAASGADVDGVGQSGTGELALTAGDATWRNITQTGGAGRVRGAAGTLTVFGGSIGNLHAEGTGAIDLFDIAASLANATYAASGVLRQWWTTSLRTEWAAGVPAPNQPYSLRDGASAVVASGQTDGAGNASLGAVLALTGATSGVVSAGPHQLSAGAGAWLLTSTITVAQIATYVVDLADPSAPTLAILQPPSGVALSLTSVLIAGNASDGESGLADLMWSFDNASFTPAAVAGAFSISIPTPFETTYFVTLRVRDLEGNAAFATVSFRIDRTDPFVALIQPTNGSALRGPEVRFVGATEVGAVITINGTAVPVDAQGDFDANLTLPEGVTTIGITAVDAAGNVFFTDITLRIDSSPPSIAIFSPLNGSTASAATVDLVGFVEPGASLYVAGVAQLTLANGSFTVPVDLNEGENQITVRSVDPAGNENQTVWFLFRDTRPPVITVAGLTGSGPWFLNDSSPAFNISTDEYAFIEASTNPGGAATSASGLSLLFTPALFEGNFTLTVRATDAGGARGNRTFAIRIDITAPSFTLDTRTEGGFVNTAAWTVSLAAEAGANVTVNGVRATAAGLGASTFTAPVQLQAGANSLTIVVIDIAGNRVERTVQLTLDQTAPTVTISAPTGGTSTPDAQIQVAGDTEPGATVTVNGRDVPLDPSGHFATLVNIPVGASTITVVASDKAGNNGTASRAVTRTTGNPLSSGLPFLDQNLFAILLLLLVAVVAAGLVARGRAKRAGYDEKASVLERDLETSRAARNDLNALENFSPRGVKDEDFVSAEDFRRREAEGQAAPAPKEK